MKQIIAGKLYNTATALSLASDQNMHLYKTQKGNYFLLHTTKSEGEHDYIKVIDRESAKKAYQSLHKKMADYEEAFGLMPEEA